MSKCASDRLLQNKVIFNLPLSVIVILQWGMEYCTKMFDLVGKLHTSSTHQKWSAESNALEAVA